MTKPGDSPANNWEEKYEKEHKLRQEAETETILIKGIGINSPEMKAAKQQNNIVSMMKPAGGGGMMGALGHRGSNYRTGRELETVRINGKKYRPIKDSVEPKKHLLREMYERIGGK